MWLVYIRQVNYKLKTNKKEKKTSTTHFTHPSGYWKPTSFAYSLNLPLPSPSTQRLNQIKCQIYLFSKKFQLSVIFFCTYCYFSLFIEIFSSMFLIFVISLIKDFNINDADLLELSKYILNIKNKWFCNKSSFEFILRKPKTSTCGVRSNKVKSFLKNKARSFHNFWSILHS